MRWLWLLFVSAAAYQLLSIAAGLRFVRRQRTARDSGFQPAVSILKPLRGLDPNGYTAFVSQVGQQYPTFEILFGVGDADDPAAAEVRLLQREFPNAAIRLITCSGEAANGKVGVLMQLAEHAKYPIWVVSDSDIKVTPGYLNTVIAPLADDCVGLVTCPYRATAHTRPAWWEALGIATDFMPSTLVAQMVGVREFGLGSTLAFRVADLKAAGGFAAVADFLADDYQLAKRIVELGKRAVLSTYVVETSLGDASWTGVWRHQLRWARTIRASKGAGYAGLPITHAGVWILIALACRAWFPAIALLVLRIVAALISAGFVLRSATAAFCWLAPLWDLYAVGVWIASYGGNEVRWRDRVLRIDRDGRIQR